MKNDQTIHQNIEQICRHRAMLLIVVLAMFMGLISTDTHFRNVLRQVYAQGWGFMGVYLRHEHPSHQYSSTLIAREPTISSLK